MSIPPDKTHDMIQDEALADAVADYLSALIRLGGGKLDTKLPPLPDMELTTFLTITEDLVRRLGQLNAMARPRGFKLQLQEENGGGEHNDNGAEEADTRADDEDADNQNTAEAQALEETSAKKRFPYPRMMQEEGEEAPPISLAGVALDDPVFSKGKGGKGPFEVTVKRIEITAKEGE